MSKSNVAPFPEPDAEQHTALMNTPLHADSLQPQTIGQALEWARLLHGSSLVPKSMTSPADVLVAILWGRQLGMSVVQSLQNIAVVNGRATIWGDAYFAIVLGAARPELETFKETWEADVEGGKWTTTVKRRGFPEVVRTFSMADAAKVFYFTDGNKKRLSEKDTYVNYPRRMCKFKARHEALRDAFPDILLGIIGADEAEEITFRPGVDLDGEIVARDGVKLETLEELVSKMDFETQKAIVGGFDTLNMSRAERLVKLREYKGQDVKLIDWLKDEYAKVKTRGLPRARPAEGVVERMTNDGSIGTGPDRNATPTEVHPADAGQPVTSSTTVEKVERAAVKTSNKAAGSVLF